MFLHKAYYHSKYLDMAIVRKLSTKLELLIHNPKLRTLIASSNSTQLVFAKMASNKTNK